MAINIASTLWKGGGAKTTTAMHVAAGLSQYVAKNGLDYKVHLIDADPQGTATGWYQISEEVDGLDDWMFDVRSVNKRELDLMKKNRESGKEPDNVINVFDTSPDSAKAEPALVISDYLIIPVTPMETEIDQLMSDIDQMRLSERNYRILIVRGRHNTSSLSSLQKELEDSGLNRFKSYIPLKEKTQKAYARPITNDLHGYQMIMDELVKDIGLA